MIKVLIVEDVKTVREALVRSIDWAALGMQAAGTAEDGEEALALLERERPDILLTDIGMPRMNGLELIAAVRERYPRVKCIILSGLSEFELARQAIKLHVIDYVLKPVDPEEIRKVLARTADLLQQEKEREAGAKPEQVLLAGLEGKGGRKRKIVEQALGYIERTFFKRNLTLAEVAASVHLSEKHLNLMVKEVTGHTLNSLIIRRRMEEAARLLQDPSVRVYEVCEMIGYTDQDHFREGFKKHYGVTPTEYRNRTGSAPGKNIDNPKREF